MCEQHDYRHSAVHKERISTIIRTQIKRPSKSCITQEHHSWKRHSTPPPCYGRYSDSTLCLYSSSFSNTLPTHTIISRPLLNSSPLSPFFTPPPEPTTPSFYRPAPIFERSGPRFPAHVINIFSTPFSNSVMPILRHERKGRTVKQQQQPLHDRSWLTIWWNFCAA